MPAFKLYSEEKGFLASGSGNRIVMVQLREQCAALSLQAGAFLSVDVDAPAAVGDHAVISYQGGLFVGSVERRQLALHVNFEGSSWPLSRASWGNDTAPVLLGLVASSGAVL